MSYENRLGRHPIFFHALFLTLHAVCCTMGRTSLLQAKCLPPLIRIRQRLRVQVGSVTAADGMEPSPKTPLLPPPPPSDETQTAPASCPANERVVAGRMTQDRQAQAGEACGNEIEYGFCVGGVDGKAQQQPPLGAMISLIIDQLVGRTMLS